MTIESKKLSNQIKDAVSNGSMLELSYKNIKSNGTPLYEDSAVTSYEFPNFDLPINSFSDIAGIVGGKATESIVPNGILPSVLGAISITEVGFLLSEVEKKLLRVECTISFDQSGLLWEIADIDESPLSIRLNTITFGLSQPENPDMIGFFATAKGAVTIGNFTLDVSVTFPNIKITISQPPCSQLDLDSLFTHFGWSNAGFKDKIYLSHFFLSATPDQKSFVLRADLSTHTSSPLVLISEGKTNILSLNKMGLSILRAPGNTDGAIKCSFLFMSTLTLDVNAELKIIEKNENGVQTKNVSWDFNGNINIVQTAINLGIQPDSSGKYAVPLVELIKKSFGVASPNLPAAIKNFAISLLSIEYTYSKNGGDANKSYTFKGAIEDSWTLGGTDMEAEVDLTIVKDSGTPANDKKEVSAEFKIDGFDFKFSCDLSAVGPDIAVNISDEVNGKKFSISGSYSKSAHTATIPAPGGDAIELPPLADLMDWFVEKVSGDPYFTLPDPWAGAINDLGEDLLDGATFTIDTKSKSVSFEKSGLSVTILDIITITSIKINYDSASKAKGNSGLSFNITYSNSIDIPRFPSSPITWDPVHQQPPNVPGKGAAILDIELLALGQHTTFNTTVFKEVNKANEKYNNSIPPPAKKKPIYTFIHPNLQEAVTDLEYAVTSLSEDTPAMKMSTDGGWLVGAHAKFLGQADVQFIFDDPEMYGLRVVVNKGKNKTLNKLNGLKAEILYRKVSETVGEYEGSLTLPLKIRKMQFGNAFVTLPSIAASIYTNGDFSFNIGFPYHLDFSHSFSVIADSFTGAGGFYFAKLNGLHPKFLPSITIAGGGVFNPITEIGLGLRVGRAVAFQKGPLSASASIALEALFQGTFAKFSPNSAGDHAEYYKIHAAIEIIGHIQGKINFAIIQATLDVTAYIRADATLEAYKPCLVTFTAAVDVAITVSIDLGLFSIDIHCHFSMTFTTYATLASSSSGIAPWKQQGGGASQVLESSDNYLLMGDAMAATDSSTSLVNWQSLTTSTTNDLTIDILPQPTSTGTGKWFYVCQFAMNLDDGTDSYKKFVEGLLVWALYAITKPTASSDYDTFLTTTSTITKDQITAFTKALNNNAISDSNPYNLSSIAPSITDVKALFSQSTADTALFTASVEAPTSKPSGTYKAAFFPIFSGTAVDVNLSTSSAPEAPTTQPNPPDGTILTIQEKVFIEFVMLTIGNAIDKVEEQGAFDGNENLTISDIVQKLVPPPSFNKSNVSFGASQFNSITEGATVSATVNGSIAFPSDTKVVSITDTKIMLSHTPFFEVPPGTEIKFGSLNQPIIIKLYLMLSQSPLHSIAGMTTRFMLHGTRQSSKALYSATGQQQPFTPSSTYKSVTMNVSNSSASDWGISPNVVFLASTTPLKPSLIHQLSKFTTGAPTLTTSEFKKLELMPLTHPDEDKQYQLKIGIDIGATGSSSSLWHFPKSLVNGLSSGTVSPDDCSLKEVTINAKTRIEEGPIATPEVSTNYFVTTVDFTIKKIPLPVAKGKAAAYMKDAYQMGPVNHLGLLRLEELINQITYSTGSPVTVDTSPIANLQLSYTHDNKVILDQVGGDSLFMLQSNFSTDTSPLATPDQNTSPDFIYKLWTSGTTDSGGYYLYWKPGSAFPKHFFDSNNVAKVSLVITLKKPTDYATGIILNEVIKDYTHKTKTKNLFIEDSGKQVIRPYFNPGKIPIRVTRDLPVAVNPVPFSSILNHSYNLLNVVSIVGGLSNTISPINKAKVESATGTNTWYYDHVFSPIPEFVPDGTGIPPVTKNPYQYIDSGTIPTFSMKPVDLFGNEWSAITPENAITKPLSYTDPIISLKQLPYLHLDYSFNDNGDIVIDFAFTFKGYGTGTGEAPAAHQPGDLWAYARVIYQFADSTFTATISTSLATTVDNSTVKSDISANLTAIYKILEKNILPASSAPLYPTITTVNIPVTVSSLNPNTYFALHVKLMLERTQYVDSVFSADSEVAISIMNLPPKTFVNKNKGTDKPVDYHNDFKPFATDFEGFYNVTGATDYHMKIAVGAIDRKGADPNAHQVWVVRYGVLDDIDITFVQNGDEALCYSYSPRPLSNKLLSKVNIPFKPVSGVTPPSNITATNVDLDAEMLSFLKAVDNMFTPEMMVPASFINPSAIKKLSLHKKAIVEKLINYVTYSPKNTEGVPGAKKAAQELYKQECLKELCNFYKIDAVGVLETAPNPNFVSTPQCDNTLNFLGTLIPTDEPNTEVTLTTEKTWVANKYVEKTDRTGQSYMAFGVFPKQLSKHSEYKADLEFKLTALEHDIETVEILEGGSKIDIKEGAWFRFVNSVSSSVGNVKIPLPLRAFPTAPRLGKLYAKDLANVETASDANTEMKHAKAWSLNGEYTHSYVAQDSVGVEVSINTSTSEVSHHSNAMQVASSTFDLFDALIQFRTMYPSIKAKLDTLSTITNPSGSLTDLSSDLGQFEILAGLIASAQWSHETTVPPPSISTNFFKITEEEDTSGDADWTATVKCMNTINSLGFLPQLQIPGYEFKGTPTVVSNTATYKYKRSAQDSGSPESIKVRTVVVAPAPSLNDLPFNILKQYDGIMALKIMRNMGLADDFHYETSDVSYRSVLYPLLTTDELIKVEELTGTGGTTLQGHLTNLFTQLQMDYTSNVEVVSGQFQIVVSYNFPPNSGSSFIKPISIPVLMRIPTDFKAISEASEVTGYITEMATAITTWINANYGDVSTFINDPNTANAFFNFDISLFSGSSNTGNPILRIKNAELKCSDISN